MKRVQERYMRWVLGVGEGTPRYLIREEDKREKLRIKIGRRAIRYGEKLEKGEAVDGQGSAGKRLRKEE